MKKIAVPVQEKKVSAHFGHAPEFKIYSVEAEKIEGVKTIENPGHQPGLLPKLLNEAGADTIIASGMGQKAISLFEENNIKVICGAAGTAEAVVEAYLAGEMNLSANVCTHDEEDHQGCDDKH